MIQDDDLSKCVHCGLCLNACPTFRVTGNELESPRGRIDLMTRWTRGQEEMTSEQQRHFDLCLGCRTCEAVCPSGVEYGKLIEGARAMLPKKSMRLAASTGLKAINLTRVASRYRIPRGRVAHALGPRRHRVAFLVGCVMPVMYPAAHRAAVRLLQIAGAEVWFPPGDGCCGALHAHNGDSAMAERLHAQNMSAWGRESFDALVVDSAGCGAHLKDRYQDVKTYDLSEWLAEVGLPEPRRHVDLKATYQDACHLAHAQRIKKQPRDLLSMVGVELVESPNAEICCGGAGIYFALEPEMSKRILSEKVDDVLSTGVDTVITVNPGCQMQLERGLRPHRRKVRHIAEVLVSAY